MYVCTYATLYLPTFRTFTLFGSFSGLDPFSAVPLNHTFGKF